MKRLLLSAAATALLLTPLACDFTKTGNQLVAEKVMVGTLFSTPDVSFSPTAMAGFDAGTPRPDGGFADQQTIPGQTAAFVFLGTRNGDNGTPAPLADANVRIETQTGTSMPLESQGAGTYSVTSDFGDDGGVKYQSGATYNFVAAQGGSSYVGQVKDAPALERIEALHPASGYIRLNANQGLTLQRPSLPSNNVERTLGFVTVFPLGSNGEKGQPTYTNVPKEPLQFLQLVALPTEWQAATIAIPGTAFPQPSSNYLVTFQTVRMGGAESDNLFYGSALLVGTADLGFVRTQ